MEPIIEVRDVSMRFRMANDRINSIKEYAVARLAFSIATVVVPEVLIVDEVLSVGDAAFQEKSRARMMELMGGGTTVLFVSHSLPQIREMCSRVAWLDHGGVKLFGEAQAVCDAYEA